jgi:hypothetical protein
MTTVNAPTFTPADDYLNVNLDNFDFDTKWNGDWNLSSLHKGGAQWIHDNIFFDKEPERHYSVDPFSQVADNAQAVGGEPFPELINECCDVDDFLTYITLLKARNYDQLSKQLDTRTYRGMDVVSSRMGEKRGSKGEKNGERMNSREGPEEKVYEHRKKEMLHDLINWKEYWSKKSDSDLHQDVFLNTIRSLEDHCLQSSSPNSANADPNSPDTEQDTFPLDYAGRQLRHLKRWHYLQNEKYVSEQFPLQDPRISESFFDSLYHSITFDPQELEEDMKRIQLEDENRNFVQELENRGNECMLIITRVLLVLIAFIVDVRKPQKKEYVVKGDILTRYQVSFALSTHEQPMYVT